MCGVATASPDTAKLDLLSTITREVEAMQASLEDHAKELHKHARKRQRLESDLVDGQDDHDTTQQFIDVLLHDKRCLERKLEEKEKIINNLQKQKSRHEQTIHSLELKLATADVKEKQKIKNKLRLVKQEKKELVARIEAQRKEIDQLQKKKAKLSLMLDKAQKARSKLQSQLKLKNSQLSEVQKELEGLQNERDRLKRELHRKEEVNNEILLKSTESQKLFSKVSVVVDLSICV